LASRVVQAAISLGRPLPARNHGRSALFPAAHSGHFRENCREKQSDSDWNFEAGLPFSIGGKIKNRKSSGHRSDAAEFRA
jgi:hypothetical protein